MTRRCRNLFFFVFGIISVSFAFLSLAETIPATASGTSSIAAWKTSNPIASGWTQNKACLAAMSIAYPPATSFIGIVGNECRWNKAGGIGYAVLSAAQACPDKVLGPNVNLGTSPFTCPVSYSCPAGQNWTLTGQSCTRPDCDPGQTRDPSTGLCNAPQCTLAANAKIGMDMFETPRPQPSGVTWCVQNCNAYITTSWYTPTKNYGYAYVNGAGGSASTCQSSGSNEPVPTSAPPEPPAPPCASGQGVVTNSSGKVLCVDQNTVPTSEPPKVNKKVDTVTNPDGSQKITNTIQTCTGAGACSTVTNVTITNASNGQPGTAGTPGTTISVSEKPGAEQSGFCAQNPTLEICKGGMNQEATQAKVLEELEKINKPTVTDDSGISGKTFETTTGRDALTEKDDQLKNYASGALMVSGVESSKSAWESAMSGGWFDSISSSGCSPYTATISGRTWVFDYCEKAALISEIGAYGLWFMLAVGAFVTLTGGKKE